MPFHVILKLAEFEDEGPNSGTGGSCGLDRERFYRTHGKIIDARLQAVDTLYYMVFNNRITFDVNLINHQSQYGSLDKGCGDK